VSGVSIKQNIASPSTESFEFVIYYSNNTDTGSNKFYYRDHEFTENNSGVSISPEL
jgi:hypothetical protein